MMTATTHLKTAEVVNAAKTKSGSWKIKVIGKNTYRYLTTLPLSGVRSGDRQSQFPGKNAKKRNNVEVTIFQYCFHTRNNKT